MTAKKRLDELLVERGHAESRAKAQALILAGLVFDRGGHRLDKAGKALPEDVEIDVKGKDHPWVSRGGLKLAHGLDRFAIDPAGLVALDVGASTGGFTDVLLQHGASRVYAVDVGKGQLHQKLRTDPRVVVREGINARLALAEVVDEPVSLVVMDLSFISLTKVLPAVMAILDRSATVLAMVKPQFELSPKEVGRGGVVREDALREKAVQTVVECARSLRWIERGRMDSPVHGPAGNREIFVRFDREESP